MTMMMMSTSISKIRKRMNVMMVRVMAVTIGVTDSRDRCHLKISSS